jgi:hypothetical protein
VSSGSNDMMAKYAEQWMMNEEQWMENGEW